MHSERPLAFTNHITLNYFKIQSKISYLPGIMPQSKKKIIWMHKNKAQQTEDALKINKIEEVGELNIEEEFKYFLVDEPRLKDQFELNDFLANRVSKVQFEKQITYLKNKGNSKNFELKSQKVYAFIQNLNALMEKTLDFFYLPHLRKLKISIEQLQNFIKNKECSKEEFKIQQLEKIKLSGQSQFLKRKQKELLQLNLKMQQLLNEKKQLKTEIFKDTIRRILQLSNENKFIEVIREALLNYLSGKGVSLNSNASEFTPKQIELRMKLFPTLDEINSTISRYSPPKPENPPCVKHPTHFQCFQSKTPLT